VGLPRLTGLPLAVLPRGCGLLAWRSALLLITIPIPFPVVHTTDILCGDAGFSDTRLRVGHRRISTLTCDTVRILHSLFASFHSLRIRDVVYWNVELRC